MLTTQQNPNLILPPGFDDGPASVTTERWETVGRKGDLVIELHFGNFVDRHTKEAALLVYSRDPSRGVYVPLRQMWAWNELAGARNVMATDLVTMAERIYGFATHDDTIRLLDAVMEFLEDLKDSPLPPRKKCRSLDYFLEEVDRDLEGGHMFYEVGGERIRMGG
jgi:hypothetical protein